MSGAAALSQETTLASRARDGDQQALAELYRRHSAALLRHARRMLGDDAAAQDIVQEAFARAIANIGRTREQLHFKAWIFRITTNLCLRALTRNARCRPSEAPDHNVASADEQADPERVRRRREIGTCVQEALDRLPARYRQILLLREIEQLSYEELADVLEMSKASVKVTLHRARARFAVAFISGQMLSPEIAIENVDHGATSATTATPDCEQLEALMVKRERRALERHLEQCPCCREREKQRCARRFAVLPPLPPLALGLGGVTALGGSGVGSVGSAGSAGVAATGAGAGASVSAGATAGAAAGVTAGAGTLGWVAAAASGVAAAVIVASVALGPSTRPARASNAPAGAASSSRTTAAAAATKRSAASAPSARLASRDIKSAVGSTRSTRSTRATMPISRRAHRTSRRRLGHPRGRTDHAGLATSTTAPARRSRRSRARRSRATSLASTPRRRHRGRRGAARPMVPQARDDEQPPSHDSKRGRLSLVARFASGTVEVRRRGGQRLMLRDGKQLRLGDTLTTRGAGQLTLLFPGHQWIVARGTLRLIAVPPRNALAGKVRVALLAGAVRARGNRRGGGVAVHHGRRRRVHTASGEMRIGLRGSQLVISSIDATVDVSGPHARRTVSAGLGLTLSSRPGFAHALLSAPTTLRPVLHRGRTAPMLSWKGVARARAYGVVIGRDADFFNVVERAQVTSTHYKPRLGGLVGKFYWKIVALGAHRGAPSKVYGFRVTSD